MANVLSINGTVQFQAPANSQTVNETVTLSTSLAPTGTTFAKLITACNITAQSITLPDVTTPGAIVLRNLDNTNTITYGASSGSLTGTLLPNALNIWSPTGTTLEANTTGGTAQLYVFATSS